MRAWWAEYGRYVITGVVLGSAILFGWNQWQASIANDRAEASMLFEEVMNAVESGDIDAAQVAADTVFAEYEQTVYPGQTRLAMARLYMDKGRDQDAAQVLRGLLGPGEQSEMQMVARLRLAKILLYQNKPDEVVELLQDRGTGGFAARYGEVLGDAYAARAEYAQAQAAYMTALSENADLQTVDTDLVQLKLNDLPDPAEVAAANAAADAAVDEGEPAVDDSGATEGDGEAAVDDGEAATTPDEDAQEPAESSSMVEPETGAETGA